MIQQFQPIRYDFGANQLGGIGRGIAELGDVYKQGKKDREFGEAMKGVKDSKSLLELFTTHPDKYNAKMVEQMQEQEEGVRDQNFMNRVGSAKTQAEALAIVKSDPSRYTKQIASFVEGLPTPERDAIRKREIKINAYINSGKIDMLEGVFQQELEAVNNSGLDPAEIQERTADIQADIDMLAESPEVFAEMQSLEEEGYLGAENYKKMMEARGEVVKTGQYVAESEADVGLKEAQTKETKARETKLRVEGKALQKKLDTVATDSLTPPEIRKYETEVRDQFAKEAKSFIEIYPKYRNVIDAPNTGAGALVTIIGLMKVLDPTSTVTGGEQATAANSSGWTEGMRNVYNKAAKDGRLSEGAKKQFLEAAGALYKPHFEKGKRLYEKWQSSGEKVGVDNILEGFVGEDFFAPQAKVGTPDNGSEEDITSFVDDL